LAEEIRQRRAEEICEKDLEIKSVLTKPSRYSHLNINIEENEEIIQIYLFFYRVIFKKENVNPV
jgi:hypothetical protein